MSQNLHVTRVEIIDAIEILRNSGVAGFVFSYETLEFMKKAALDKVNEIMTENISKESIL